MTLHNTHQALIASGYEPQADPAFDVFTKPQYLVGFKARVYERVLEIQGAHKNTVKSVQIIRCHPSSFRERDADDLRLFVARAETQLRSALLGSVSSSVL